MKKLITFSFFIFISSCGSLDFTYKNNVNITNPLYEKTNVFTSGINLTLNSYIPMVFGDIKITLTIYNRLQKIKPKVL